MLQRLGGEQWGEEEFPGGGMIPITLLRPPGVEEEGDPEFLRPMVLPRITVPLHLLLILQFINDTSGGRRCLPRGLAMGRAVSVFMFGGRHAWWRGSCRRIGHGRNVLNNSLVNYSNGYTIRVKA